MNKGGGNMKLTSKEFENEGNIPSKFTCQGEDINPELKIEDMPDGAKSFALSVKDPDAPMGTWVHWLVYNIPADKTTIEEDSVPGEQVMNDFGREDYGGPCPPSGIHRYYFTVYALDTDDLGEINSKDEFDRKVDEHTIEKAELMGKYSKN
ncbi:YbhB/YbcL family Raf kinase inhibitor-like protein [Candidatus Woesearchaeota archaeon]|nr:YbhB/YbcL family Raf kinase inhibitor-like protein [Candidatus Woesearchaeota archaeon]